MFFISVIVLLTHNTIINNILILESVHSGNKTLNTQKASLER